MWWKRMKKKLNVDSIQSELRGGSAFFPGYKSPDSPTPPLEKTTQVGTAESSSQESNSTTHDQPLEGVPPTVPLSVPQGVPLIPNKAKGPIRQRHPFEFYKDHKQRRSK